MNTIMMEGEGVESERDKAYGASVAPLLARKNRTPLPSDFQHIKILMIHRFKKDMKNKKLFLGRLIATIAFFTLWNLGSILSENQGDTITTGEDSQYRISTRGEPWSFPAEMSVGGAYADGLERNFPDGIDVSFSGENNATVFGARCDGVAAGDRVCVFFAAPESYTIYFGGDAGADAADIVLAGAQHAVNEAILKNEGGGDFQPIDQIQIAPTLTGHVNPLQFMQSPMLSLLAICLGSLLIHMPIIKENVDEVKRSYMLVGVKLSTYMMQWWLYLMLVYGLFTTAMITVVSSLKVFPLSSGGLIFLTALLSLIQYNAFMVVIFQVITSEEFASAFPLLYLITLGAIIVPSCLASFWRPLLSVLTVFVPLAGFVQSWLIFGMYEENFGGYLYGYGTGVTASNLVDSGLLGNIIGLVLGVLFWAVMIYLYASPGARGCFAKKEVPEEVDGDDGDIRADQFEPLPPGADIVMSIRGLRHTYYPGCFKAMCSKAARPAPVLKGLDVDICRGEVFGYLGHNGAGKTTSVHILGTEIQLQSGDVTYHTSEGVIPLDSAENAELIRKKIGICPQHNTTIQDDLTARETLRLFARLKGQIDMEGCSTVDEAVEAEVERRLEEVRFTSKEDADKPVGTFSGGMQRKVLIAMALLGDPEVVFLDEPTAGLDPYNRRVIWDMITSAKAGRSIILTTHFLDEADILSDRIGIIKDGKLITSGSPLFLKHNSGVGYTLSFDAEQDTDLQAIVDSAESIPVQLEGQYKWRLQHGTEAKFPAVLKAIKEAGGTKVALDLTSLEQVFLETGKEDRDNDEVEDSEPIEDEDDNIPKFLEWIPIVGLGVWIHRKNKEKKKAEAAAAAANDDDEVEDVSRENADNEEEEIDPENVEGMSELLSKIWEPKGDIEPVGDLEKVWIVTKFACRDQLKDPDVVFGSIIFPIVSIIVGFILVGVLPGPSGEEFTVPDPTDFLASLVANSTQFFVDSTGLNTGNVSDAISLVGVPASLPDFFSYSNIIGGYFAQNKTLQYTNGNYNFALNIGTGVMADLASSAGGISTILQQLPYTTQPGVNFTTLLLPTLITLGFQGVILAVLLMMEMKGNNVFALFRVAGISEWVANCGILGYKILTSYLPMVFLVIIFQAAMPNIVFGSGGIWLASIIYLVLLGLAASPMPMIFGKFITLDYKTAKEWLPTVIIYAMVLPYIGYELTLQLVAGSEQVLAVIGDVLSIWPLFAFQYGFSKLMSFGEEATWAEVWGTGPRIWLPMILMALCSAFEWWYLHYICTKREPKTKLSQEEETQYGSPVDVSNDVDVSAERDRSRMDDNGINARDLVKCFRIQPTKDSKNRDPIIKQSVKGVSYGIRKNEIFALLGPNGAGKTVSMSMLAGRYAPEYGEVALDGKKASGTDRSVDHMYANCTAGYCPQFDALFPRQTVEEHLKFYASVRGLKWDSPEHQEHINAIIRLLGLSKYRHKEAKKLSGGYKRRLSLAVCMIGYPKVMLVDEITTGLDPGARRLIWDVLKPPVTHDSYDLPAILLSSHYMDECQELGSRIGIMIDGELVATGTLDRLQELHCDSFFVEIALHPNTTDSIEPTIDVFEAHNMSANVYESLPFHYKLKVPIEKSDLTEQLATIFEILEGSKEELGIQFYSVSMMNLEQIFIDLSRKQFEADEAMESKRSLRISMRDVSERRLSIRSG